MCELKENIMPLRNKCPLNPVHLSGHTRPPGLQECLARNIDLYPCFLPSVKISMRFYHFET